MHQFTEFCDFRIDVHEDGSSDHHNEYYNFKSNISKLLQFEDDTEDQLPKPITFPQFLLESSPLKYTQNNLQLLQNQIARFESAGLKRNKKDQEYLLNYLAAKRTFKMGFENSRPKQERRKRKFQGHQGTQIGNYLEEVLSCKFTDDPYDYIQEYIFKKYKYEPERVFRIPKQVKGYVNINQQTSSYFLKRDKYINKGFNIPQIGYSYEPTKYYSKNKLGSVQLIRKIETTIIPIDNPLFLKKTMQLQIKESMKDIKDFHKIHFYHLCFQKKLAFYSIRQVQKRYQKCQKNQKDYITRAKKLYKESAIYWRKKEKELIEIKKKKEKLEAELKKREEQEKESLLQKRKLEFLMRQSDLYAHFIKKNLQNPHNVQSIENIAAQKNYDDRHIDNQMVIINLKQKLNQKKQKLDNFNKKDKLDLSKVDQRDMNKLIGQPNSFQGNLKQYQLKGLRWLDNLHQQAINGILADQMGLGKTIQAIALLIHLSENKNIWGPFLIIAPSSTLYNWQQELNKFGPSLRVLPYWGSLKQRKTIRKFFSEKKFIGIKQSPFHVVITSYQLVVTDQKTFHRLKWQYLILDQAHAIKNIFSQRWKTLMQFQSRNRLLLTGTPIQNKMAELWALLHFIMPQFFDSHEQFQQWFSKDIEAHSQDQKAINHHQVQRLRAMLKPFMLRREKQDVQHEIGKKYQYELICQLTTRQQILYDMIKQKLPIKEFYQLVDNRIKNENLMNLVMQFRKVCNHPELFERRPNQSPIVIQKYHCIHSKRLQLYFNVCSQIIISCPKMVYNQILSQRNSQQVAADLCQLDKSQYQSLTGIRYRVSVMLLIQLHSVYNRSRKCKHLSTNQYIFLVQWLKPIIFPDDKFYCYIPRVTAPSPELFISSSFYLIRHELANFIMFGGQYLRMKWQGFLKRGIVPISIVDFKSLVADSAKLKLLDKLLAEKIEKKSRVLIFCQMTKMLDILEDYMIRKKYKFFRLDGSLNIADRRDMVNQFQINNNIFAFLLSTRAGGLGVTLTAADTVIFYDNDWNPTMDAQATDRVHRIGQEKDVHVYKLITKNTVEERIIRRAQQKRHVHEMVYQGTGAKPDTKDLMNIVYEQAQQQEKKNQGRLIRGLSRIKRK